MAIKEGNERVSITLSKYTYERLVKLVDAERADNYLTSRRISNSTIISNLIDEGYKQKFGKNR